MNDRSRSGDFFWQLAGDYYAGREAERRHTSKAVDVQHIPINVYETSEDIVLVAPMPGVEAENIDIEVLGSTVTLRASLRGPGQQDRRYLLHEWTYGPYERSVDLPADVDAEHANASHGNGVLVLSLPKATRSRSVKVPLQQTGAQGARREGHSGHHTRRDGLEGES